MSTSQQNRIVWVGNLEPWMDEAYLDRIFGRTGNITQIKLVRDKERGALRTRAVLEYALPAEAERFRSDYACKPFVSPDGHAFRVGQTVQADSHISGWHPGEVSLFVGNLDVEITDADLKQFFANRYGSVTSAKVAFDHVTGQSKHFGFVRFAKEEEAQQALAVMQGALLGRRPVRVKPATKPSGDTSTNASNFSDSTNARGMLHPQPPTSSTGAGPHLPSTASGHWISFSGLDPRTTEVDVLQMFKAFGVVYRGTAYAGTGSGVAEFRDYESAEKALQYLRSERHAQAQFWTTQEASHCTWTPVEPLAGMACAQPAVTNTTMERAQTQLQRAQGTTQGADDGLELFQAMLWDPYFMHAFELELAQGPRPAAMPSPEVGSGPVLPWLLQDRPDLFQDDVSMDQMNEDFLPAPSLPGAGGRKFPSVGLTPGLAPGLPPLSRSDVWAATR